MSRINKKSNLNNFMNKKIKKYSWIHELNQAALESKLISEAKIYSNAVQLNEARRISRGQTERPVGNPSLEQQAAEGVGRFLKDIGVSREAIMRNAGDIIGAGRDIAARPSGMGLPPQGETPNLGAFREMQQTKMNVQPRDIDGDGEADAEDVKLDAADGSMDGQGRMPSFPWAHQAGMPTSVQHPPAPNFGGMTPNEMTRAANAKLQGGQQKPAYDFDKDFADHVERLIKTAPPGKVYSIQDLQHMARLLGS
jgi:hypothetical protein